MGSTCKVFSLLIVAVLAASSIIMIKPERALALITTTPLPQVTPSSNPTSTPTPTPTTTPIPTTSPVYPKPQVPEFTLKLVDSPTEANKTKIELTIKNQPFDKNNINHYSLVYNVRIKTDDENWTDLYDAEDGYPAQSNSEFTVLSYVLGESAYYPSSDYPLSPSMKVGILPTSGQVDFQVEAMIGYRDRGAFSGGMMPYVFKGESSGWSNTQSITILNGSAASESPNTSPTPEFLWLVILPLSISILLIAVAFKLKSKKV